MTFTAEYEVRCFEASDIVDHLPFLHDQALGKDVIELGVRSGNSTAAFLAAVEKGGGHVWSVDTDWPMVPDEWGDSELWDFILGDDLDVLDYLPDQVDVVFIDTVHTYTHTLAELELYADKLRPGGVFLLHDTELDFAPSEPAGVKFPVRNAIEDWIGPKHWVVEWRLGCYGLGIIHKPG